MGRKKFQFPPPKPTKTDKMLTLIEAMNEELQRQRGEIIELRNMIEKRQTINLRLRGVPGVRNQTLTHRE